MPARCGLFSRIWSAHKENAALSPENLERKVLEAKGQQTERTEDFGKIQQTLGLVLEARQLPKELSTPS